MAAKAVYQFFWHDFCDWYLEFSKITLTKHVLSIVLHQSLSLLHPFMPFITDEIWSIMPGKNKAEYLDRHSFPDSDKIFLQTGFPESIAKLDASIVDMIIPVIDAIRSIRGENRISPSKEMSAFVFSQRGEDRVHFEGWKSVITKISRVTSVKIIDKPPVSKGMAHVVIIPGLEVFVPLEGLVDFAAEIQRLDKEIAKLVTDIERRGKRLEDQNFVSRADPEIVEEEREALIQARSKLTRLEETRRNFAS
jgi:valyl-tRNA synthetase